jgi:hypothetical protein
MRDLDLLNEPIPPEWASTRHCPMCNSVELRVSSDEVELGGWCTISCLSCGRELRRDYIDGRPTWQDPEWVKAGEQ